MQDLKGKLAVVTGAGMGMGRLLTLKLAEDGARIAAVDVNKDALASTAKEARDKGAEVIEAVFDITDPNAVYAFRDRVHSEMGKVSLLVNNAGVVHGGRFLDVPDGHHRHTMEVNIMAIFWMTKAFLPDMVEGKAGHICNIASAAGLLGVSRGTSYSASKWAVIGFTEALRTELYADGLKRIKFTIVCPSFVGTGMFEGATPPKTTRMLRPETMVRFIYEGIKKDKLYVMAPFAVKITPFLKWSLPTRSWDQVSKMMGLGRVMDHWKGREKKD